MDIDLTDGDFRLERDGGTYVVMGPGNQVVQRSTRCIDVAISTLNKIGEQARRSTRSCLCCGRGFTSEGRHNRMCGDCRYRRSGLGKEWG